VRRISPLLALALAVGCAASSDRTAGSDPGGAGGKGEVPSGIPSGGPLATAGPDRRVLPGDVVRLDGRGSSRGEDGRAISFLWSQEEGPRVALDDPSATVASFVAPARDASGGDRLVFRLLVSDGSRLSADRVAIEVVDRPEQIAPAPVVLGGADQEVLRGARVQLPLPTFVDAGCLGEADPDECLSRPPAFCWTQVEGTPVAIDEPCDGAASFDAPSRAGVLTFRLDAHRHDGSNRSALCLADGAPSPDRPFCAPPDHVRVFVRERDARRFAPVAEVDVMPTSIQASGPLVAVERTSASYPQEVVLYARHGDPTGLQTNTLWGWRPLVGVPRFEDSALTGEGIFQDLKFVLRPDPGWPRTIGIAFEAQYNRVRAAPAAVVLSWRPPTDLEPLAAEGAAACGPAPDGWCAPFAPGDEVVLRGAASPRSVETCWEQLAGPPVELEPEAGCLPGVVDRTFTAPEVPEGAAGIALSFRFTARDGGPLSSPPDVAVVRVAPQVEAPEVELIVPEELRPGEPAILAVVPADGTAVAASRWRSVWHPDSPEVTMLPTADCAPAGACVAVEAGPEAAGSTARFEAIVTDEAGATFVRRVDLAVAE